MEPMDQATDGRGVDHERGKHNSGRGGHDHVAIRDIVCQGKSQGEGDPSPQTSPNEDSRVPRTDLGDHANFLEEPDEGHYRQRTCHQDGTGGDCDRAQIADDQIEIEGQADEEEQESVGYERESVPELMEYLPDLPRRTALGHAPHQDSRRHGGHYSREFESRICQNEASVGDGDRHRRGGKPGQQRKE